MSQRLKEIEGKTISRVESRWREQSDGCESLALTFRFTDGATLELALTPRLPQTEYCFFRDSSDKPPIRKRLDAKRSPRRPLSSIEELGAKD